MSIKKKKLKKKIKNIPKSNFNSSIKIIKKMLSKGQFSRAISGLEEITKKEQLFFENINSASHNPHFKNTLESRLQIIEKYKKIAKNKIIFNNFLDLKNKIKLSILENDYKLGEEYLNNLNEIIKKDPKNKIYINFYKKYNQKNLKIEQISNTLEVNSFQDLLKKLSALISLGKYDIAEKGIEEAKKKERKTFEHIKNEGIKSRKKVLKLEKELKRKEQLLEQLLKKIYVAKRKYLLKKKEKEKVEVFNSIKIELNSMIQKEDFISTKNFIESKLKNTTYDLKVVDFLNKKLNIVSQKIKQKEHIEQKKLNVVDEATKLLLTLGENGISELEDLDKKLNKNNSLIFIYILKKYLKKLQKSIHKKFYNKAIDELNSIYKLDSNQSKEKIETANQKFHQGMTKVFSGLEIKGYDFFGKIKGADMVTGDTFVFTEKKDRYWFSLGDATGHGIKAGFTVSNFTKNFNEGVYAFDLLEKLAMHLNNVLKTNVKSGNFITCLFFEILKNNIATLNVIGMGHEPIFIYRAETQSVEQFRPFGIAAGIRKISKIESIKKYNVELKDGDILISYTDGIIECKNSIGEYYGLERFSNIFNEACKKHTSVRKIYNELLSDAENYSQRKDFDDDLTMILLKRNSNSDVISSVGEVDETIKALELVNKIDINTSNKAKLKGKTKEEVLKEIEKLKLKKELKAITSKLHEYLKDGEIIKLKEEALKYIKKGYVSSKLNYYLKKAISMESSYRISIKEKKVQTKYDTLMALYSKGDYKTVIKEAYDVVVKNGNI